MALSTCCCNCVVAPLAAFVGSSWLLQTLQLDGALHRLSVTRDRASHAAIQATAASTHVAAQTPSPP